MFDSHGSDVIKMVYFVLQGKIANLLTVSRGLDIRGRRKMIEDQYNLIRIENGSALNFLKLIDGNRRRHIISQGQIHFSIDQLARNN